MSVMGTARLLLGGVGDCEVRQCGLGVGKGVMVVYFMGWCWDGLGCWGKCNVYMVVNSFTSGHCSSL